MLKSRLRIQRTIKSRCNYMDSQKLAGILQKQFEDYVAAIKSFKAVQGHDVEIKDHQSANIGRILGLPDVEDEMFYAGGTYEITIQGSFRVVKVNSENTWRSADFTSMNTKVTIRYDSNLKSVIVDGWGNFTAREVF